MTEHQEETVERVLRGIRPDRGLTEERIRKIVDEDPFQTSEERDRVLAQFERERRREASLRGKRSK